MTEIPKTMRIGHSTFSYQIVPGLPVYGRIHYDLRIVQLRPRAPAKMRVSFWHETTHAILNEMQHPLARNEAFVTNFSMLLSKAIDSARF